MTTTFTSSGRGRVLGAIAIGITVLAGLRVVAPSLAVWHLNRAMADLGQYRGRVSDVDLALWRGAYVIEDLVIEKAGSTIDEPLLQAPRVDASLQWRALLQGELVADATLTAPVVNFVQRAADSQYGEDTDWRQHLESLLPIRANRVEIVDGRVHFLNPDARPAIDVFLSEVNLVLANLTNVRESSAPVFAGLDASAVAMGHAPVKLRARFDPLQNPVQFDINFDLRELELTRLNPLLVEYTKVTAEAGTLSLSAEIAAADGAYEGYLKPLLDHAEFVRPEDFRERPLGAIWDTVVGTVSELLRNQPRDRLGTRIPVSGTLDPELELWPAVGGVLGNMLDGLLQGIDGSVDLEDALQQSATYSPLQARLETLCLVVRAGGRAPRAHDAHDHPRAQEGDEHQADGDEGEGRRPAIHRSSRTSTSFTMT